MAVGTWTLLGDEKPWRSLSERHPSILRFRRLLQLLCGKGWGQVGKGGQFSGFCSSPMRVVGLEI